MSDPTNAGGAGDGQGGNASTPPTPSEPSAEYKGLQRETGKTIAELKKANEELAARVRQLEPQPSVQEELERERAARQQLEREVSIERLKSANPEIADVIGALSENGVPSVEVIDVLKTKIAQAAPPQSSGLRNNPARQVPTQSEQMEEILRNGKAF